MKIYVVTHKWFDLKLPNIYKKLMVGAALGREKYSGFLLDSDGENISEKNKSYCELTGLYWIWKNSREDIVGLVHYRRFFANLKKILRFKGRYFSFVPCDKAYCFLEKKDILEFLKNNEVIVKKSDFTIKCNKSIVYTFLKPSIWDEMEQGVKRYEPDYYHELVELGKKHTHINCNMFIGYKNVIDNYCKWLFVLLDKIDASHTDRFGEPFCDRELGYMGEFLFGLWLEHNKVKYIVCDVISTGTDGEVGSVMKITEFPFFIGKKLKRIKIMKLSRKIWIRFSSLYMLKKSEKFAFGLPFKIHCAINHNRYSRAIKKFKNIHEGETCFVIGTGPSLTVKDVEMLKNKYTFGVNTLYKLFETLGWQTTFYCLIDPKTYRNISDEIKKQRINNLFYAGNRILSNNITGIPFELNCSDFYRIKAPDIYKFTSFSNELDNYIYDGGSVIYAAIQIAVYMGFKKIVLLGVDCNYSLDTELLHGETLSYTKDYKYNWTKQTGLSMIEGFKVAKEFADKNEIEIINATRGGMLEVFRREKLEDVIGR